MYYHYFTIEECEKDLALILAYKAEPTEEHYWPITETYPIKRFLPFRKEPQFEAVNYQLPKVIDGLKETIASIAMRDSEERVKEATFYLLNPPRPLTPEEQERLEKLDHSILCMQNCDAHNVNVGAELEKMYKERAALTRTYRRE